MPIKFDEALEVALVLTEDLEARIQQLVGQITKLEKKNNLGLRKFKAEVGLESPEEIARYLSQWDPSGTEKMPKGLYVSWILKLIATAQIRFPEDGVRLRNALTIFDKIKKTTRFKGDKDIHKYKSFRELESITRKFQNELSQTDEPSNLRSWFKWVERQGVTLFYKDEKFTVLRFDAENYLDRSSGSYQPDITQGVQVVPKKLTVGTHGQQIETSWVPLWAAEEVDPSTAKTVTPTAVALSRLACGTAYCVANPTTAQSYLNRGPLYATFKDGDFYLLADVSWGEFMNEEDKPFKFMTAVSAFFFSKLIVEKHEELGENAIKNLVRLISTAMKHGKVRAMGPNGEFDASALPPAVGKMIQAALQIGGMELS